MSYDMQFESNCTATNGIQAMQLELKQILNSFQIFAQFTYVFE